MIEEINKNDWLDHILKRIVINENGCWELCSSQNI